MARAMIDDPFHNFRFHVKASGNELGPVDAGFTSVTLPTHSVEGVEYKEGTMVYRRKFPGDPTFDDVTLSRGVTKAGSEFHTWIMSVTNGQEYRADLDILQFHRTDITDQSDFSGLTPLRTIKLYECFPISVKPGSDLDSLSSDISVQEVTVSLERFEIINNKG